MRTTTRFSIQLCVIAGLMAGLGSGCSPRRFAINQVANALSGSGTTFASDNDPELVREAIPFGLKTMEAMAAEVPDNRGLLLGLASGFTQYSYAFIEQDAAEIEPQDLKKATTIRTRAVKLYLRGRDWGMRGLELTHRDLKKRLRDDPKKAVQDATVEDVPLLYWTGASWAAAISLAKDNQDLMAELPAAAALVQRAIDLNESWDFGALHDFFISYDGSRPAAMGGSIDRARKHFERSIELTGGQKASPYVSFAQTVCVGQQNRKEFDQMLDKALAIDPNTKPEWRLVNLISQQIARRLKERAEELFP